MIKMTGVTFSYDRQVNILTNISFELISNERVGLIGFNGSGKTTFIQLLLGILKPTQGEIFVHDRIPNINDRAFKEKIGFASDRTNLVDYITIQEYLAFSKMAYEKFRPIDTQFIEASLEDYGIRNDVHQLMKELSQGTKKKVQLISAFLSKPPLLILDEPTNGLDFESTLKLESDIQSIHEYQGVLIASHDFQFLEQTCTSFYILDNARLSKLERMEQSLRDDVIKFLSY